MRDKMPSAPSENPMVSVRAKLADLTFEESSKLIDVRGLIDELATFARQHGVPSMNAISSLRSTAVTNRNKFSHPGVRSTMWSAGHQTHFNCSGPFQGAPRGSLGPQETTKRSEG